MSHVNRLNRSAYTNLFSICVLLAAQSRRTTVRVEKGQWKRKGAGDGVQVCKWGQSLG